MITLFARWLLNACTLWTLIILLLNPSRTALAQADARGQQVPLTGPSSTGVIPTLPTQAGPPPASDSIGEAPLSGPPKSISAARAAFEQWYSSQSKYVLSIAASSYSRSPEKNVRFVERSADQVEKALNRVGYISLPLPRNVQSLRGNESDLENIRQTLESIPAITAGKKDVVVIVYYSAHGIPNPSPRIQNGTAFRMAVADQPVSEGRGIGIDEIIDRAYRGRFRGRLVLILDACDSGYVGDDPSLFARPASDSYGPVTIITAAQPEQPSVQVLEVGNDIAAPDCTTPDPNTGMTAFAYFFAHALTDKWADAEQSRDGLLTYAKLQAYLKKRLGDAWRSKPPKLCIATAKKAPDPGFFGRDLLNLLLAYRYDPSDNVDSNLRSSVVIVYDPPDPDLVASNNKVAFLRYSAGGQIVSERSVVPGDSAELQQPKYLRIPDQSISKVQVDYLNSNGETVKTATVKIDRSKSLRGIPVQSDKRQAIRP